MSGPLSAPLELACGAVLPNRIAKAALTERLADGANRATQAHVRLYRAWARGGAGMILTGNVQVSRAHLEATGNVVLDGRGDAGDLRAVAAAAKEGGGAVWMQLSHAGRQTPAAINPAPLAPSAVPLEVRRGAHGDPVAMSAGEIAETVAAFARAAVEARECGFNGVQVHAAHGYLLSAFLSPLANRRPDEWGGALENRARMLLETVAAIRAAAGADFALSVKLNSADFQKGGFTLDECARVAGWLEAAGVDLLEVSGGSYESPAMIRGVRGEAPQVRPSTLAREAFFIDYAAFLRARLTLPLMVTGGFRTRAAMEEALQSGAADVIGLGRPLIAEPDLPARLLAGASGARDVESAIEPRHAGMAWHYAQIARLGAGEAVDFTLTGEAAMVEFAERERAALAAWEGG